MDGDEVYGRFRAQLIGGHITFVRLLCDMVLLYVDSKPGDGRGLTLWLNPPWQVVSPDGVVADSSQAASEDVDGPTTEQLDLVSTAISSKLHDRPITDVQVDPRSRELKVTVAGEFEIEAIASDLECDHLWHLRDHATRLTLYASTADWKVRHDNAAWSSATSPRPSASWECDEPPRRSDAWVITSPSGSVRTSSSP